MKNVRSIMVSRPAVLDTGLLYGFKHSGLRIAINHPYQAKHFWVHKIISEGLGLHQKIVELVKRRFNGQSKGLIQKFIQIFVSRTQHIIECRREIRRKRDQRNGNIIITYQCMNFLYSEDQTQFMGTLSYVTKVIPGNKAKTSLLN